MIGRTAVSVTVFVSIALTFGACTAEPTTTPVSATPTPTEGSPEGTIQLGNALPQTDLEVTPFDELADNRIGLSFAGGGLWSYPHIGHLDRVLVDAANFGAKRIDTSLYELEPPIDWSISEYHIPRKVDQLIDDLAKDGVAVNYMLHFWDKAGHAQGERLSTPRFKTDGQIDDFLDYVRFVVRHFRGRIAYYTVWSEPDNDGDPIKYIEPKDYIHLARRTIPAIRREDPEARIVSAPTVLFYAHDYLFTILRSDVIRMFDVISWHPMYDVAPDTPRFADYYYEYPSIVQDIKRTASAHGFRGEYWGTELSWCAIELVGERAGGCWAAVHTDIQAAKYYARGIVSELGMDVGVGLGGVRDDAPWSYPTIRRLSTVVAGARPATIAVEVQSGATDLVSYGFSLPGGDRMLALWRNGTAVDHDPGVAATLSFRGSASRVVGIDVLHGFQQELITTRTEHGLVVDHFVVRDYPIFLRLIDWMSDPSSSAS